MPVAPCRSRSGRLARSPLIRSRRPMSWETPEDVLTALVRRTPVDAPMAVVVAHPDDETIGVGALLALFRRLLLIHVTDGAPRNLHDAQATGFATCGDYAAARRRELVSALRAGNVFPIGDGQG